MNLERVGKRLKDLRIAAGYTSYRNFADEHGLEPKQYWKLEEGKSDFKFSSLVRLLAIHKMTIQEFFKGVKLSEASN